MFRCSLVSSPVCRCSFPFVGVLFVIWMRVYFLRDADFVLLSLVSRPDGTISVLTKGDDNTVRRGEGGGVV